MDTTDALLMDATNKMDDTAFLDEVIASYAAMAPQTTTTLTKSLQGAVI